MPSIIIWDNIDVAEEASKLIVDAYYSIIEGREHDLNEVLCGIVGLCDNVDHENNKERLVPLWVS